MRQSEIYYVGLTVYFADCIFRLVCIVLHKAVCKHVRKLRRQYGGGNYCRHNDVTITPYNRCRAQYIGYMPMPCRPTHLLFAAVATAQKNTEKK